MRIAVLPLLFLLLTSPVAAEESAAARQYQALLDEYEQNGGARVLAGRFVEFAEQHRNDPAAVEALLWVIERVPGRPDTTRAVELLERDHLDSQKLASGCVDIARSRSASAERLLRKLLEQSPHRQVRAEACYALALLLDNEANIVEQLKEQPELAPRVLQYYGSEYGKHLSSLDHAELDKAREQVYTRMLDSFADVVVEDESLGKKAEEELFALRHLSVGRTAPEIEGEDIHGNPMRLSHFRGKVVMLSFWGHW